MMTFVISGGYGDGVNQISKAILYCKRNEIARHAARIIYVRDIHDEKILDTANPLTRGYAQWVKDLVIKNGFQFELVFDDQKLYCERIHKEHPDWVILGPNLYYGLKIWEEHRGLFIGFRPGETEMTIDEIPVPFTYDKIEFIRPTVGLQVRFGTEYPTKYPNAAWQDKAELLAIIKVIKANGFDVVLLGETKEELGLFRAITNYQLNLDAAQQYNYILSCDYTIGFSGFFSSLSLQSGKKFGRLLWDQAEWQLQVPKNMQPNCFDLVRGETSMSIQVEQCLRWMKGMREK